MCQAFILALHLLEPNCRQCCKALQAWLQYCECMPGFSTACLASVLQMFPG